MENLSKLGESGIIALFSGQEIRDPVLKGVGDDCAVIKGAKGEVLLLTTDLLIEGVHFVRRYGTAEQLGAKALAVNLSDIAAMGGSPEACLLALALPRCTDESWLLAFRDGFVKTAEKYGCQIVGGDTCGSTSVISVTVTVIGKILKELLLWRTGAEPGDDIWISGIPGLSMLGMLILEKGEAKEMTRYRQAVEQHLCPIPEIELGCKLASGRLATSCIDTSDGIAMDLGRLCEVNNVGAVLEERAMPLPEVPQGFEYDPMHLALHGGEDYGLLFTAHPSNRERLVETGSDLHRIGVIDGGVKGVWLLEDDGSYKTVTPSGFSHF